MSHRYHERHEQYFGAGPATPVSGKVENVVHKGVQVAFLPVKYTVHTAGSAVKKVGDLLYKLSLKF